MHGQMGERAVLIAVAVLAWIIASHILALAQFSTQTMTAISIQYVFMIVSVFLVRLWMRRTAAYDFVASTEDEFRRVSWPPAVEVKGSVIVLLVALLAIAVATLLIDFAWQWIFKLLGFLTLT